MFRIPCLYTIDSSAIVSLTLANLFFVASAIIMAGMSIMEYGSTLYVGVARGKNGSPV